MQISQLQVIQNTLEDQLNKKNDGHKWRDYGHTHRQQQQFIGHVVLLTTAMVVNTGK